MLTAISLILFILIAAFSILLDQAWTETARLRLLAEMRTTLDRASDTDELVEAARDFGERLFAGRDGAIYLTHRGAPLVLLAAWWGSEPIGAGFGCARIAVHRFGNGVHPSVGCLRLRAAGETVGFLTLLTRDAGAMEICDGATAYGDHLAHALAFLRLRQSQQHAEVHTFLRPAAPVGAGRDAA
ncbi:MAG TPA: hypothetical protein VEK57_29845 [Thermoanaerobaculia bacterium]|nr:hypothetical protein [Thermoanaerobaculia bacterium]